MSARRFWYGPPWRNRGDSGDCDSPRRGRHPGIGDSAAIMINPILLPELRLMLAEKDDHGLAEVMTELHPATVSDFTEGLTVDETWEVLSHAPLATQAEIFSYYSNAKQEEMVLGGGRQRMSALLEEMAP